MAFQDAQRLSANASRTQTKHVAVFPPATCTGCRLEIWPDAAKSAPIAPAEELCPPYAAHGCEEEDPERWDGLS